MGSPGGRNIALTRNAWFEDPQAAIGLHPVFADIGRTWATHTGPVETVTEGRVVPVVGREEVTATATTDVKVDGAVAIKVPVGDALAHLPRAKVEALRAAGWTCKGGDEVLSIVYSFDDDRAPEIERLFNACDDASDATGEEIDYTLRLDPAQAEAWCEAHANSRWSYRTVTDEQVAQA